MRPDEHKKKKNTLYKKKHGIKSEKPDTQEHKSSKPNSGKGNRSRDPKQRPSGASAGNVSRQHDSESSDSDVDATKSSDVVYEKKTFSRRQIVSNWGKYDLPETEESAEPRGEDFSKLLSSAGSALAQFRFKDERDWEEEDVARADTSRVISLDCHGIAAAMDCIPLYERLSIDKTNFSENQIILQDLEAAKNQELCKNSPENTVFKEDVNKVPSVQKPDSVKVKIEGEITLTNLAKSSSVNLDFGKPEKNTSKNTDKSTKSVVKTSPVKSDEDELDFLLSLDSPGGAGTVKTDPSAVPEESSQSPQDLKPSSSETLKGGDMQSCHTNKKEQVKEEDLEDWLDSVLGD